MFCFVHSPGCYRHLQSEFQVIREAETRFDPVRQFDSVLSAVRFRWELLEGSWYENLLERPSLLELSLYSFILTSINF